MKRKKKFVLRAARRMDMPEVEQVMEQYAPVLELREKYMPPWNHFLVVTTKAGHSRGRSCKVIGTVAATFTLELRSLAIDPEFERRGLGTKLVKAAEKRAKRWQVKQVVLLTEKDTAPFFKKLGYGPSRGARVVLVKDMAKNGRSKKKGRRKS